MGRRMRAVLGDLLALTCKGHIWTRIWSAPHRERFDYGWQLVKAPGATSIGNLATVSVTISY